MKTKILMAALVSLLVILVVSSAIPAGDKGQGKAGRNAKAPEMERGMFVNIPYWTSPPWYPPEEETDTYRWGPRYHWADPSIDVLVNVTASGFTDLDAVVAEVENGFSAWSAVGTDYSATVSRDDDAPGPSLWTSQITRTPSPGER